MLLRLVLCIGVASICCFSAISAGASMAEHRARALGHAAQAAGDASLKETLLARAEHALKTNWTRPLQWNAHAAETMSWILALRAAEAGSAPQLLAESRDWALTSVRRNPSAAVSWMRLAALSLEGADNNVCAPPRCLENSWSAAPVLEPELSCTRLRLAHDAGIAVGGDDARITSFLQTRPPRQQLRSCLYFLSDEEFFAARLRLTIIERSGSS